MSQFAAIDLFGLIVFVAFILFSVLANWMKRRQAESEETSPTLPPPVSRSGSSPAASTQRAASWEEEIRRMLEGQTVEPAPPPPPVVVMETRRAPAPVAVRNLPEEAVPKTLPVPPIFARRGQEEESEAHEAHELTEHSPRLITAEAALSRANQLHAAVAERMRAIDRRTENATPTLALRPVRTRPAEAEKVVGLLRSSGGARQVLIAQTILGTPRALEFQ